MLSQMTGMAHTSGRELGRILGYCENNRLPLLNLLVVRKDTGKPDEDCGVGLSDLPAQQARVFVYDWLAHGVPRIEELVERPRGNAKTAAAL
jgi:hypothetical protein